MSARRLALCAVMTALLIAVQFAFGFVSGIEFVTALFAAFCFVFGTRCGLMTGTAFSLLRCIIFGFYPNVIILYLVYYSLFAALFGTAKKRRPPKALWPAMLMILGILSAALCFVKIPVSAVYAPKIKVMLAILAAIFILLCTVYCVYLLKRPGAEGLESVRMAALASLMTVLFTLLDDVITPLFYGYTKAAAVGYFYGGFIAMIPQTICAAVSVWALFLPLKKVFERYAGKDEK